MTLDPRIRALFAGPNYAHVATLMPDGSPHSAPVWIGVDGDDLVFTREESSLAMRNFRRDPRVAISIHNVEDPYECAYVRGRVTELRDGGYRVAAPDGHRLHRRHIPAAGPRPGHGRRRRGRARGLRPLHRRPAHAAGRGVAAPARVTDDRGLPTIDGGAMSETEGDFARDKRRSRTSTRGRSPRARRPSRTTRRRGRSPRARKRSRATSTRARSPRARRTSRTSARDRSATATRPTDLPRVVPRDDAHDRHFLARPAVGIDDVHARRAAEPRHLGLADEDAQHRPSGCSTHRRWPS